MQKTATSTFEIIHRNVLVQASTPTPGAPWRPHGELPLVGGETIYGDIARLNDGRLLAKSSDGQRFAWVDSETLGGAFCKPVSDATHEKWYNDAIAGFRDGALILTVPPPQISPEQAEWARHQRDDPYLWARLSQLLEIEVEPAPKALFSPGVILRDKRRPVLDADSLLQRHIYHGDFGHGTFDPTPPSEEELWCYGSDALTRARTNSIAILTGRYPIISQYDKVGIASVKTAERGPATLITF